MDDRTEEERALEQAIAAEAKNYALSSLERNREYQRQLQGLDKRQAHLQDLTRSAVEEPNFAAKIDLLVKVAQTADAIARTASALACMRRALTEPRRPF
jgi:hypothetical protein